ncbi:FKBP-type peptidyl-prolyl cis-trans isomerase, partial [Ruminococcaceae bacterium OttesenSCG-928-A11]|nr:FKBP-type peptidyl-prolyl cis-trans isomerase [Ruminococcaceae bacterium OttesenSCG-928-A11]
LREGDGEVVSDTDTIKANYTGWDSTGAIFDTTKKSVEEELAPISFGLQNVIEGWTKGLTGKKVGGVYVLTIPGEMAYGNEDTGSGYPVGPLKFVVEIINIEE